MPGKRMTPVPNGWEAWAAGAETVWLPTAAEMGDLDREAVATGATTERTLIEAAGREVAVRVQAHWPEGPVVAVVGRGHNGADALVALRTLHSWGRDVSAILASTAAPDPDVLIGWDLPLQKPENLPAACAGAAVLIDGILGTGVTGAPREPQASVIEQINQYGIPVAAVDGPSGADFSTGEVAGSCIRAALTVSLGWPKIGLLRHPARDHCGRIECVEIGFPPPTTTIGARAITGRWVARTLIGRAANAHKGRAGYLVLLAGQAGMAGAAVLGARSALRGGVGILKVVGDPANREVLQRACPGAIYVSWEDDEERREAVQWSGALAIGPGLGRASDRRVLVEQHAGRPRLAPRGSRCRWIERVRGGHGSAGGAPDRHRCRDPASRRAVQTDRSARGENTGRPAGCGECGGRGSRVHGPVEGHALVGRRVGASASGQHDRGSGSGLGRDGRRPDGTDRRLPRGRNEWGRRVFRGPLVDGGSGQRIAGGGRAPGIRHTRSTAGRQGPGRGSGAAHGPVALRVRVLDVRGPPGHKGHLGLFVALLLTASGLPAQTGGWRPDERVLITDFGIVTSLARSSGSVFAATTGGLLTFDEAFERSELPITVEDGFPPVPPTAMVFDRRDRSLWIAAAGELLQFDPFSRRFRDRISVRQPVTDIVPGEASGSDLFVRTLGEWWRLDTFSRDRRRAQPAAVLAAIDANADLRAREEALRDPFFLDAARQATRTPYAGSARILDVIPSRDAYGWWLGTAGQSLVSYDGVGRVGRRTIFGPAGAGMASVVATDTEVWFAPELPLEGRYAVAVATADLQQWRAWRADSSRAVPDLVSKLVRLPGGTWAAGESGLHWMGDGRAEWRQERDVDLSYTPLLAMAAASGPSAEAVWLGSTRGLLRVRGVGGGVDIAVMPSTAVGSVVEADQRVWIGTDYGLYSMPVPDSIGQMVQPRRAEGPSALRSRVGALIASGDTVYAGLEREVWWRAGRDAPWARMESIGRARARVSALAIRDGVLWVGSAAELTVVEVAGSVVGSYSFGPDLPPGPRGETAIADIAVVSSTEAWLALPAGAIRLHVRH